MSHAVHSKHLGYNFVIPGDVIRQCITQHRLLLPTVANCPMKAVYQPVHEFCRGAVSVQRLVSVGLIPIVAACVLTATGNSYCTTWFIAVPLHVVDYATLMWTRR